MNIKDSAYHTVHDYPGGSESLGPRVGISPAVLRNKVNPNNETHHLTLAEAERLMNVTGDNRILHALARDGGYLLKRIDGIAGACDGDVIEAITVLFSYVGGVATETHAAMADGVITASEVDKVEHASMKAVQAFHELIGALRGMQQ